MSPMQNPDTAAAAKVSRRSRDLRYCGALLLAISGVALVAFGIASIGEGNNFWTPTYVAITLTLFAPFFIAGLLLSILSCQMFAASRIRTIAIVAMLIVFAAVWYPFQGHEAFMLYVDSQRQAYLLSQTRYCAFPIIDL